MMESQEWYPDVHLFSDASGSFGCGAWWGQSWLQVAWTRSMGEWSIAQKELFPIVLAVILWGKVWKGRAILVHCDNQAAVEVMNSGYSRDTGMMQLIRCLFLIRAFFGIELRAVHIPGHLNVAADAISRDNIKVFHMQVPEAHPAPSIIPAALMDLLAHQQPDWTSPDWSRLFMTCFRQV